MKLRYPIILALLATLLAACNMTLAADVTPPPNYVPPTPMPTMGPLFPAQPMDIANGEKIYAEKCAACHGTTGLGDGEQGKQLPVKVAAIGLAEVANKATPADWYKQVTQGNLEKFMPPFNSLNDQERWDVVGYALSLHTAEEQLAQGKTLFASNCADCEKYFSDLESMSALSADELTAIAKNGMDEIPAFGKTLSDEELSAVVAYLRSLTFSAPVADLEPTATPEPVTTPEVESTPADGTQTAPAESTAAAESVAGVGSVSGSVDNQTGAAIPADAKVILHGYEHAGDMNAGPTEVSKAETPLNADGTFLFENIEVPENRIFIAEVSVNGLMYQSEFAFVEAGMTSVELPAIVMYASTDDLSQLKIASLQLFFDFANADEAQMFAVYSILNESGKTVTVDMGAEQKDIPFLLAAEGTQPLGFEASQDSAPFVGTENGFAMPPSQTPYGLIAFSSIVRADEMKITQPVLLSVDKVDILLPEGMKAEGNGITEGGLHDMQGMKFQIYTVGNLAKDSKLEFTITGSPSASTAVEPDITQNQNLLIGVGAFGVVLILLGAWFFIRDRNKQEELDEDEDEDEEDENDAEDVMDSILALDDLHRAGKITDEAYQKRREELKGKLKR